MNEGYPSLLRRGASSGLHILSGIGRRLLVHTCSLLAACFVALGDFGQGYFFSALSEGLALYIGLICLLPRGEMDSPSWYFPTITGLVQSIILFGGGYPLPLALFLGGLQTWLQRLLQSSGNFGWEWTVSPMLLACLFLFFEQTESLRLPLYILWSFPLMLSVGWAMRTVYMRRKADAIHQKMLENELTRLQSIVGQPNLPHGLRQEAELLLAQSKKYASFAIEGGEEGRAIIDQLVSISRNLEEAVGTYNEEKIKPNLLKNLLRSSKWQHADGANHKESLEKCLNDVKKLNVILEEKIQKYCPVNEAATETDIERQELERITAHEHTAQQLLQKKGLLPDSLANHIETVACAAIGICQNMRSDPQDRSAGNKFLGRYLKVVHRIVDEHIRLSANDAVQEDVAAALVRSEDILARLAQVFQDERAGMLRNDAVNYTAELNALEKLLAMRGH